MPIIDTDVIEVGDKIKFKMPVFSTRPDLEVRDEGVGIVLEVSENVLKIEYFSIITNETKHVSLSAERIDMGDYYVDIIKD